MLLMSRHLDRQRVTLAARNTRGLVVRATATCRAPSLLPCHCREKQEEWCSFAAAYMRWAEPERLLHRNRGGRLHRLRSCHARLARLEFKTQAARFLVLPDHADGLGLGRAGLLDAHAAQGGLWRGATVVGEEAEPQSRTPRLQACGAGGRCHRLNCRRRGRWSGPGLAAHRSRQHRTIGDRTRRSERHGCRPVPHACR